MKKISIRFNLIIGAFIICFNVSETFAGTWYDIPNANENLRECSKKFVGLIEAGDLTNNIENLIGTRICLDSPGGSLSEVTNFIHLIQEKNGFGAGGDDAMTFATRVQSGDKCESACAVLFMFGSNSYRTSYQDKILEPGAKLGFHSPFIDPRLSDQYLGDVAFAGGLQIANLLTAATYKTSTPAGVLPQELLSIVLGTPPDQMYYVDTCAEMYILGISTPDASEVVSNYRDGFIDCENDETVVVRNTLDAVLEAAHRVCAFSHVVTYRKWFVNKSYKLSELHDFAKSIVMKKPELLDYSVEPTSLGVNIKIALNSLDYWIPNLMTNTANQFCIIDLKAVFSGDQARLTLASPYVKFGSMYGYSSLSATLKSYDNFSSYRAFGLSPLGRKFTVSKEKNTKHQNDALPAWARKQKILLSCGIDASESKVANVTSYTNFRQQAGLNGRVIGRVGLGEKVRILDPGRYLRYDRCAAACEGSNQDAIKQCIDNNDVWIEVQYNGRRGFLSRKFLE